MQYVVCWRAGFSTVPSVSLVLVYLVSVTIAGEAGYCCTGLIWLAASLCINNFLAYNISMPNLNKFSTGSGLYAYIYFLGTDMHLFPGTYPRALSVTVSFPSLSGKLINVPSSKALAMYLTHRRISAYSLINDLFNERVENIRIDNYTNISDLY